MTTFADVRSDARSVLPALHRAADELVAAVHDEDLVGIQAALARARRDHDGDEDPVHALLVLLAAAVPEDMTVGELVAWAACPVRYRRIRSTGMAAIDARATVAHLDHQEASYP